MVTGINQGQRSWDEEAKGSLTGATDSIASSTGASIVATSGWALFTGQTSAIAVVVADTRTVLEPQSQIYLFQCISRGKNISFTARWRICSLQQDKKWKLLRSVYQFRMLPRLTYPFLAKVVTASTLQSDNKVVDKYKERYSLLPAPHFARVFQRMKGLQKKSLSNGHKSLWSLSEAVATGAN